MSHLRWLLLLLALGLAEISLTPAPARFAGGPLQYGEFCYWEKGLAKLRDAQATASINLVPLGDQHE